MDRVLAGVKCFLWYKIFAGEGEDLTKICKATECHGDDFILDLNGKLEVGHIPI